MQNHTDNININIQESFQLNKPEKRGGLTSVVEVGQTMGEATTHEAGYIQIPVDADKHKWLLGTIDGAQWEINRGIAAIGRVFRDSEEMCEYLQQDLGSLVSGLADLSTELSEAKRRIEESQQHLPSGDNS